MTLTEFYKEIGSDGAAVIGRFANNEKLVLRFLGKFKADTTFAQLTEQMGINDLDGILRASHTLKGVAGNLGLDQLQRLNQEIVTSVRSNTPERIPALFEQVKAEYEKIISLLDQVEA